jgi:hypothetical protein
VTLDAHEKELIRLAEVESENLRETVHALADFIEHVDEPTHTLREWVGRMARAQCDAQLMTMRELNKLRSTQEKKETV